MPEWPFLPHSSTWELLVLASAHVLQQFPATNQGTFARHLTPELVRGGRTGSHLVPLLLAHAAHCALVCLDRWYATTADVPSGPPGEQLSELLVRATAHALRACPVAEHGALARTLAHALDTGGQGGVVEFLTGERSRVPHSTPSAVRDSAGAPSSLVRASLTTLSGRTTSCAPPAPGRAVANRTSHQPPPPPPACEKTSPVPAQRPGAHPSWRTCIHIATAPTRQLPMSAPAPLPPHALQPVPRAPPPSLIPLVPPLPSSTPVPPPSCTPASVPFFTPAYTRPPTAPAAVPSPIPVPAATVPLTSKNPTARALALALLAALPPADRVRLALRLARALAADAARTLGGVVLRAVRRRLEGGSEEGRGC
ncbi:hypothetical protein HYPSUDRAFT_69888 [Hypholoma sublateritium FD-334 SS-4]|uniref:Uncharacterized protein n=1 Tax=Hypholoma sublateritium (strain FD-334 SS-4) TaxID=945553 RepID=A0A0D2NNZ1_HYPSF|nr:hypothetical protein HYPSUDRAFT_69888 [Hypholoma sublateritium FD-334 SS-4]